MAVQSAAPVDMTLAQKLEKMTKEEMIRYASEGMGFNVDPSLDVQTIKEKLLIVESSQKENARKINLESLKMTMDLVAERNESGKKALITEDPPLHVKFYNMQSPRADLEFSSTEPYGFYGQKNKYGFRKAPHWHLFHGEIYVLPLSVIEHLKSLTYTTSKPIIDQATGMQSGSIPVVNSRFTLEIQFSKGQLAQLGSTEAKPPGKEKNGE